MSPAKPWETKEWKQRRDVFLEGKSCQWCGSKENLVVHHLKQMPSYDRHSSMIANSLVRQLIQEGKVKTEEKPACPNCKYRSIYKRKMKPTYKCQKCGFEFDKPAMVPTDRVSKEDFKRIVTENKEVIKKIVTEQRDDFFQNSYMKFEDCIVLCNKCHLLYHKGFDLCPICKKPKKTHHKTCWECFVKTPQGQKAQKEHEEYKKLEAEWDAEEEEFFEIVDKVNELEAQGKHEEAKRIYKEWEEAHNDEEDEDEE